MPRYTYTQESGSNFKVNTSDKCDALESENEKRQILDDLGDLLGHTKFDDAYPKDASAGGTLGNVKLSNFSSTGAPSTGDDTLDGYAVGSRWINMATDKEYVCLDSSSGAAVWIETTQAAGGGDVYASGAFTVNAIPQISTTGGVIKASVFAATTGDVFDFGAHSAGFTEQQIATTTGTVAVNWNNGNKALYTRSTGTAGGAATFTFTAPVKSMNLMLTIVGSTAGCTGAVTLPTVYWANAAYPSFSTGVSCIDAISLYYSTGLTKYLGMDASNFSTV